MRKPHLEKLNALLENDKLPRGDRVRVKTALERYAQWVKASERILSASTEPASAIEELVRELNSYKAYIELELIFDSEDDFLYRQKGQLKLDNSIVEEFLPVLVTPAVLPEVVGLDLIVGATNTFSSLYFASTLNSLASGPSPSVRTKDQDFAIAKPLFIRTGFTEDLGAGETKATCVAYVAAECKTNLDKTMFQEATATAHDVKTSVPGAKYYLLCEWLDMTPISTAPTDIDEVIILRKAKRLASSTRSAYSTREGRRRNRDQFRDFIVSNPIQTEMIARFVGHIRALFTDQTVAEGDVLRNGYF